MDALFTMRTSFLTEVPYEHFQIQLGSWQPTNRWHVRNFRVR